MEIKDKYETRRKWKNKSGTKLYFTWRNMMRRCFDKKDENFNKYGGRGISVCDEWKSYDNFANDMKSSFVEGLTLDRVNVNRGYCKENCRWASVKQQQNNKTININIWNNGVVKTISEWAEYLNLTDAQLKTVYKRHNKYKATTFEELFVFGERLNSYRVSKRKNKCKICGKTESCAWYINGTVCNNCANIAMRARRKDIRLNRSPLVDLESYCNLIKKMEIGECKGNQQDM